MIGFVASSFVAAAVASSSGVVASSTGFPEASFAGSEDLAAGPAVLVDPVRFGDAVAAGQQPVLVVRAVDSEAIAAKAGSE